MDKLQNTKYSILSLDVKKERTMKFFCWVKKGKMQMQRGSEVQEDYKQQGWKWEEHGVKKEHCEAQNTIL